MKRQRMSDADVLWAIATADKGTFDRDAFTDILRCRRALRRIERLYDPGNGTTYDMIAKAMLHTAKRALGKVERR